MKNGINVRVPREVYDELFKLKSVLKLKSMADALRVMNETYKKVRVY